MGLGRENRGARARPRSERRSRGSRARSCTADRVRGIKEKHSLVTLTHRYPGRRAAGFLAWFIELERGARGSQVDLHGEVERRDHNLL